MEAHNGNCCAFHLHPSELLPSSAVLPRHLPSCPAICRPALPSPPPPPLSPLRLPPYSSSPLPRHPAPAGQSAFCAWHIGGGCCALRSPAVIWLPWQASRPRSWLRLGSRAYGRAAFPCLRAWACATPTRRRGRRCSVVHGPIDPAPSFMGIVRINPCGPAVQVLDCVEYMVDANDGEIPILLDGDTGFGGHTIAPLAPSPPSTLP